MRKLTLLAMVIAIMVVVGVGTTTPALANGGGEHEDGGPAGAKLVLNISYRVTNDEDSGIVGYWALDNYIKTVKVWQLPDGSFSAVVSYVGAWHTFAGALSPSAGVTQAADGAGTLQGGYTATITGTFTPGSNRTHGRIGAFDFGGTKADILLGTYGAGQTGNASSFDWVSAYFGPSAVFSYVSWGWTYHYRGQTWVNASTGNSGDIVIAAMPGHDAETHGDFHGVGFGFHGHDGGEGH